MQKKFWIPLLCVIVILAGCDEGQKMMKPALTPKPIAEQPPVEQPMPETEVEATVYPEITHENALNLIPGETYRIRPSSYDESPDGFGDLIIWRIYWGTVDSSGKLHKSVSPGTPERV